MNMDFNAKLKREIGWFDCVIDNAEKVLINDNWTVHEPPQNVFLLPILADVFMSAADCKSVPTDIEIKTKRIELQRLALTRSLSASFDDFDDMKRQQCRGDSYTLHQAFVPIRETRPTWRVPMWNRWRLVEFLVDVARLDHEYVKSIPIRVLRKLVWQRCGGRVEITIVGYAYVDEQTNTVFVRNGCGYGSGKWAAVEMLKGSHVTWAKLDPRVSRI